MKFRLEHDSGDVKFDAEGDGQAQEKAREYLKANDLIPQRKRNYLFRHNYYPTARGGSWRWDEVPFMSAGKCHVGWC